MPAAGPGREVKKTVMIDFPSLSFCSKVFVVFCLSYRTEASKRFFYNNIIYSSDWS